MRGGGWSCGLSLQDTGRHCATSVLLVRAMSVSASAALKAEETMRPNSRSMPRLEPMPQQVVDTTKVCSLRTPPLPLCTLRGVHDSAGTKQRGVMGWVARGACRIAVETGLP